MKIKLLLVIIFNSLALLSLSCESFAEFKDTFLKDISISGYLQARTEIIFGPNVKPEGILSTEGGGKKAGGEINHYLYLKTAYFALKAPVIADNINVVIGPELRTLSGTILDLYLNWEPIDIFKIKIGKFRIPFGIEPQISSSKLITTERSILYSFGNFGYSANLGFGTIYERDIGLRLDAETPFICENIFAGIGLALIQGKSMNFSANDLPSDFSSRMHLRYKAKGSYFSAELGFSGYIAKNKFRISKAEYIPIGIKGDLDDISSVKSISSAFENDIDFRVYALDLATALDKFLFQIEILNQSLSLGSLNGFSMILSSYLDPIGLSSVQFAYKLERTVKGWEDNIHLPSGIYKTHTIGLNWYIDNSWKVQLNYIFNGLNDDFHGFYGSDVIVLQTQFIF